METVALAGGTGSSKLLRRLVEVDPDLRVIANVGDNFWFHGLYVCPDVDIAMYSLAGIADRRRGWGIEGDTFNLLRALGRLGEETWFRLGDRDAATCAVRTELMRRGDSLTRATKKLCADLGLETAILPATNEHMETRIITDEGEVHLQEFWVKGKGRARVRGVKYSGASIAKPTREVETALRGSGRIVFCPANPVTSMGPILAVEGVRSLLSASRRRVVALSPMIGRSAFSGPAAKLMRAIGASPDSIGVSALYSGLVDVLVISERDQGMKRGIEANGMECVVADTLMEGKEDEKRLARLVLAA
ncbi:MAG TPA: 2-phospho-L-lactate transferase [Nitrososphaerales archaeon]|nr:2-phospho-L-lactate transferase [Nitrososphaerales archaeon]